MSSPIPELLRSMNAQTLDDLAAAAAIKHGPESGRARENAVRKFLRPLLADAFGISTGFILDASGAVSEQQDIVIYRRDYHPSFVVGGIHYFMAEAVVGVIQCRSRIASRQSLESALENIASAKRLDRTDGGRNYVVAGGGRGEDVDPVRYHHQMFGAIVTERSLAQPDHILINWLRYFVNEPFRNWPNMYVDVHRLTVHYIRSDAEGADVDPNAAEYLAWSAANISPPLVLLAQQLMTFLRIAPVIDFHPHRYFPKANFGPGRQIHVCPNQPQHEDDPP